jgi:hypothetical protein
MGTVGRYLIVVSHYCRESLNLAPGMINGEPAVSEKNPIKVFVTHTFEESDDYLRIFEFLESVDRFYYLNVAKPENVPADGGLDAIKDELIQQIKASEAVVVVPDVYARKPDLVNYMMDVAEANGIGMIAVKPFGGIAETAPEVVERVQEHIEWNDRELVDAVKRQGRGENTARWEVIDFPGYDADGKIEET